MANTEVWLAGALAFYKDYKRPEARFDAVGVFDSETEAWRAALRHEFTENFENCSLQERFDEIAVLEGLASTGNQKAAKRLKDDRADKLKEYRALNARLDEAKPEDFPQLIAQWKQARGVTLDFEAHEQTTWTAQMRRVGRFATAAECAAALASARVQAHAAKKASAEDEEEEDD